MELMVAQFMALYANRTRQKNERVHKPSAFMPDYTPPDPDAQDDAFLAGFKRLG